jgi:uncharacterized protein
VLSLGKTYNLTTELAIFKKLPSMKLHPDASNGFSIHSYSDEGVVVNGKTQIGPLLLCSVNGPQKWSAESFQALTQASFDELLPFSPELVIFGSGKRIQFPAPKLLQGLYQQRIGLETMDNGAACRTFNVLAGEGRHVVLVLIPSMTG